MWGYKSKNFFFDRCYIHQSTFFSPIRYIPLNGDCERCLSRNQNEFEQIFQLDGKSNVKNRFFRLCEHWAVTLDMS